MAVVYYPFLLVCLLYASSVVSVGVELAFVLLVSCNMVAVTLLKPFEPLPKIDFIIDLLISYSVLLVFLEISYIKVVVSAKSAKPRLISSLKLPIEFVL